MFENLACIPLFCGEFGKLTKRRLAKLKNDITFINTFSRFLTDGLRRYRLQGAPDTISERAFLQSLLWYGNVVVFEEEGGIFALPGAPAGGFNIYGDPAAAYVFSNNSSIGFNKEIRLHIPGEGDEFIEKTQFSPVSLKQRKRGVIVWENAIRYPFINHVIFFAQAVSDTMRTLDVCRANVKNPYLIVAEESVVPSVRAYFEQRDDNVEYIISSGVFDSSKVNILPIITASDSLKDCTALIEWYEAKYRELCGIRNNAQMDKKGENLLEAEISVNDQYTENSVEKCIEHVQKGLDLVNRVFGTSMKVEAIDYDENILSDEDGRGSVQRDDTRDKPGSANGD